MRIGGLASGMDTDQIISDLMKAKKIPLDKLTQEKVWAEWQRDSYREFNLSLSSLKTSAEDLRFQRTYNAYSSTSSDPTDVTATTTADAVNGSYEVKVVNVASSAKMNSAATINKIVDGVVTTVPANSGDKIGAGGTITLNGGTPITISSDDTYAAVAKKLQDSTAGKTPELRGNGHRQPRRCHFGSRHQKGHFPLD